MLFDFLLEELDNREAVGSRTSEATHDISWQEADLFGRVLENSVTERDLSISDHGHLVALTHI